MRVIALIQARMGSTRLPFKSLLCLHGLPLIDWVTRRTRTATRIDECVVAIPDTAQNDALAQHLDRQNIAVFRGHEADVLSRMYHAAKAYNATHVVRVCADNPLIWGVALDALLHCYATTGADYAYNHIPKDNLWPDGLGAETLSFTLLEEIHTKAVKPEHREHCLSYLWEHAYHRVTFNPDDPALHRPDLKLDIDTPEDFCRLARLPLHVDMTGRDIVTACMDTQTQETMP